MPIQIFMQNKLDTNRPIYVSKNHADTERSKPLKNPGGRGGDK